MHFVPQLSKKKITFIVASILEYPPIITAAFCSTDRQNSRTTRASCYTTRHECISLPENPSCKQVCSCLSIVIPEWFTSPSNSFYSFGCLGNREPVTKNARRWLDIQYGINGFYRNGPSKPCQELIASVKWTPEGSSVSVGSLTTELSIWCRFISWAFLLLDSRMIRRAVISAGLTPPTLLAWPIVCGLTWKSVTISVQFEQVHICRNYRMKWISKSCKKYTWPGMKHYPTSKLLPDSFLTRLYSN